MRRKQHITARFFGKFNKIFKKVYFRFYKMPTIIVSLSITTLYYSVQYSPVTNLDTQTIRFTFDTICKTSYSIT